MLHRSRVADHHELRRMMVCYRLRLQQRGAFKRVLGRGDLPGNTSSHSGISRLDGAPVDCSTVQEPDPETSG